MTTAAPVIFVSRKEAAELLRICIDTFDQWVREGFLPPASITHGQIIRWHWPTIEAKFAARTPDLAGAADPYMTGVNHAKGARRGAA